MSAWDRNDEWMAEFSGSVLCGPCDNEPMDLSKEEKFAVGESEPRTYMTFKCPKCGLVVHVMKGCGMHTG